jgi:hypothetical protein
MSLIIAIFIGVVIAILIRVVIMIALFKPFFYIYSITLRKLVWNVTINITLDNTTKI